ncbi:flavin reductase family protein [Inquilinus sp. NPDC058860]|uniref:flavin reductase family protein n=1 Tax=Inquilinus sp. NPDC058860 TaxID=3346652 RepID=UPI0036B0046F
MNALSPHAAFVGQDDFRAAMRELAGGVAIVTTGTGDDRRGLTATAVCSLSAEPPTLLACVNRSAESHAAILRHGAFCVNLTAGEHQALAERFAGRAGVRGAERFAAGQWITLATGAPVLADAPAAFDCTVLDALERGSHTIFIGGVKAVHVTPRRPALVYRSGLFAALP